MKTPRICWLLVAGLLLLSQTVQAISLRDDRPLSEYSNLSLGIQFSSAGYLADSFGGFCTATQVSPMHALTASHCLDDDADGQFDSGVSVETLSFGTRLVVPNSVQPNIASATLHPQWASSGGDPAFDLAILTFHVPRGGGGLRIAEIAQANPTGLVGTMIGYGEQGYGDDFPSNIPGAPERLAAQNLIDSVGATIETDFDSPQGSTSTLGGTQPIHLEGTTGPGDSGGPLFANFGGGTYLVGVLNGGANEAGGADSEYGDVSEWAALRTSANLAFLAGFGIAPEPIVVPGDYNRDGIVNAADYSVWRDTLGSREDLLADANQNGLVDQGDLGIWSRAYGQENLWQDAAVTVPEPTTGVLVAIGGLLCGRYSDPRQRQSPRLSHSPATALSADQSNQSLASSRSGT